RPLTFHFQLEPGFNFLDPADAQAPGTYRSGVYRDPATQLLTFVYALEADFSSENAELAARSFARFTTDVEARFHTEGLISRSADGSTVRTEEQSQMQAPLGELPKVNIATNATVFDHGGSVDAFLLQRIAVFTGEPGQEGYEVRTTPLRAELALSGTLRPQAIVAAIPPPAGVWGGALLLVAAAAAGVARIGRRMHA